ncbi:unnamed protein product [Coregonus sp. 'balchen']|nr:unnamed protein product [Coregonus sp. 'balchen']
MKKNSLQDGVWEMGSTGLGDGFLVWVKLAPTYPVACGLGNGLQRIEDLEMTPEEWLLRLAGEGLLWRRVFVSWEREVWCILDNHGFEVDDYELPHGQLLVQGSFLKRRLLPQHTQPQHTQPIPTQAISKDSNGSAMYAGSRSPISVNGEQFGRILQSSSPTNSSSRDSEGTEGTENRKGCNETISVLWSSRGRAHRFCGPRGEEPIECYGNDISSVVLEGKSP